MKTMKFRVFKAEWIKDGTKSASIRIFDDKNFQKGDDVELITWETGQPFAHAIVTEIIEKPLGQINEKDLEGHESYESTEAMIANLGQYYKDIDTTTPAKIVRFRIIS